MSHDEAIKKAREAMEGIRSEFTKSPSFPDDIVGQLFARILNNTDEALTALDSLAVEPSELDSAMAWLEDESIRPSYDTMRKLCIQLVRKQRTVEPSEEEAMDQNKAYEDARELVFAIKDIFSIYTIRNGYALQPIDEAAALITARDERIRRETRMEFVDDLAHGSWGNYVAISLLEHLMGKRFIRTSEDINIPEAELPRLLEQAMKYECDLAVKHSAIMGEAKK